MAQRYKKYPFYVVFRDSGLILAGAEYREDANEMRKDLPVTTAQTQVLTSAAVLRKHHKIQWA